LECGTVANQHVMQRLAGIQGILNGVHLASSTMSSASSGQERAAFIDQFLSQVLPSPFRFGAGDATDVSGLRSGQLDVVVEYPFAPGLPLAGGGPSRLYLAEGIAAVVEVKSNAASQWNQALQTAAQLAPLQRQFGSQMIMGMAPPTNIPLFVAGYTGWSQPQTVLQKLQAAPQIDGILIIDPGIFVSSPRFWGIQAQGPVALWGLIHCLHQATSGLRAATTNPMSYVT
jgi:hypothetical protein